jgi:hypothetical protein
VVKRLLAVVVVVISLGACSSGPSAPTVPRLGGASSAGAGAAATGTNDENLNAVGGNGSAARRAQLHAAAECIRRHGAPQYQDPVLTADGYVYTDDVAFRPISGAQLDALTTACQSLIHAAHFSIRDQGPPPPKLIQAGVRSAQCLRAHGLPRYKDPTADTHFSPGKGFGLDADAVPPGGKQSPILRRAVDACRQLLDDEAAQSSLGNLGHA